MKINTQVKFSKAHPVYGLLFHNVNGSVGNNT